MWLLGWPDQWYQPGFKSGPGHEIRSSNFRHICYRINILSSQLPPSSINLVPAQVGLASHWPCIIDNSAIVYDVYNKCLLIECNLWAHSLIKEMSIQAPCLCSSGVWHTLPLPYLNYEPFMPIFGSMHMHMHAHTHTCMHIFVYAHISSQHTHSTCTPCFIKKQPGT